MNKLPCIVAFFADEQAVYAHFGRFFRELFADREWFAKCQQADTIVRLSLRKPEAQITVKIKRGEDGRVDFGPSEMVPEVVMAMDADVAHRFLLGGVNLTVALARGQIKARGPVAKILKQLPSCRPWWPPDPPLEGTSA